MCREERKSQFKTEPPEGLGHDEGSIQRPTDWGTVRKRTPTYIDWMIEISGSTGILLKDPVMVEILLALSNNPTGLKNFQF